MGPPPFNKAENFDKKRPTDRLQKKYSRINK